MRYTVHTRTDDDEPRVTHVSWWGSADLLAHTTSLVASVLRSGRTVVEVTGADCAGLADTATLTQHDRARATEGVLDHEGRVRGSMLGRLLGTPLTAEQQAAPSPLSTSTRTVGAMWVEHATGIDDPTVPSYGNAPTRYAHDRATLTDLEFEAVRTGSRPRDADHRPEPDVRTSAEAILSTGDRYGDRVERMLDHIAETTLAHDTGTYARTYRQPAAERLQREIREYGREIDADAVHDQRDRAITADATVAREGNDIERAAALLRLRDRAEHADARLDQREREPDMRGLWTLPSAAPAGGQIDVQDYREHVESQIARLDPAVVEEAWHLRIEEANAGRILEFTGPTSDPATRTDTGRMVYETTDGHTLRATEGTGTVEYRAPGATDWEILPPVLPAPDCRADEFGIHARDLLATEVPAQAREIERDVDPEAAEHQAQVEHDVDM